MAKAPEAPSREYLLALRTELEAMYSTEDKQIDRNREAREMRNVIPMSTQWAQYAIQVRDPTLSDEIQRTAAELSINPPTLTVTSHNTSEKGQENATLRENWTQAILNESGRRLPGIDTFSYVTDATVGDGGGWCKFHESRDLWDVRYSLRPAQFTDDPIVVDDTGKPRFVTDDGQPGKSGAEKYLNAKEHAKQQAGSPFVWLPVDARSVYPVWQGVKLAETLEVQKRPRSSTFRQYRLGTDNKGNIVSDELGQPRSGGQSTTGSEVDFVIHFDSTWVTYLVAGVNDNGEPTVAIANDPGRRDGEMQWKHRYQRPPYFFAPGILQNQWRGRKVGWSVAESMRYLVDLRSWLLTALSQGVGRDLNVSWFRTRRDGALPLKGDAGEPKGKEVFEGGMIYDAQEGEQIINFPYPPVSDSLKMMLDVVNTLIASLKSPQVNSLSGLEGAGFAINQVLSYLRVKYSPLSASLERMLSDVTEFSWFLTRQKVKERIWVYGQGEKTQGLLSVAPEDLTPNVAIKWTINPEQPSDKLILNRYLTERLQNGSIGVDEVIERLGDNPDEIRRSRMRDIIRASPEYQKLLHGEVLQEMERGDALQKIEEAQQIAQTGVVPPAMGTSIMPDQGQAALGPAGQVNAAPGGTSGAPQVPMQSGVTSALTP